MDKFFSKFKLIVTDSDLRRRLLFLLGMLVVFRLGAAIPIPGVNTLALERFFSGNQFFGLLNIFSGGGLSNLSIFMLGVGPFITASIIMQLLTIMFPKLKELYHESGEAGRRKFTQYSRWLTVPLATLQGLGLLALLENQAVILPLGLAGQAINVITVVAGSVLLMWLGELISEYGIGNGVSLIILAGILAGLPTSIGQAVINFDMSQVPIYAAGLAAAVAIVALVVLVTEAERPIPVTYAKRIRGNKVYGGASTYLPIRVNQAGVMPIIFALSILLFPQMIAQFLARLNSDLIKSISSTILSLLNNQWLYSIIYFGLIFVFTYFYSAITFDPEAVSSNLQKNGAFVPGIRPGRPTAEYIAHVLYRLTLLGAAFLGVVALLPLIMRALTGITALAIGGTALLIVVSVALDLMKQIDAQLSMREY
ncbi:MAG: preprotein translocase subunit SecY [Candidatus Vogelbacteria bacterium]|nr:preprotein translocase subunit SecY [Candidatus Vogelbacteria bacterium]